MTELTIGSIFAKFSRNNPWITFLYVITLLVVPLQDVALPHFYGRIVQAIQNKTSLFYPFLIVIVLLIIIKCGIFLSEWNDTYLAYPRLQNQIRDDMLQLVYDSHETSYDEQNTGSLNSKFVKLPSVLYDLIDQYKMVLIPQVFVSIAIISYFAWKDTVLGITLLLVFIAIVAIVNITPSICYKYSCARETTINTIHEEIDDYLRNLMAIYNADALEQEKALFEKLSQVFMKESSNMITCVTVANAIITPLQMGVFVFFMWWSYKQLQSKRLDTGSFVSLFFMMISFMVSIGKYVNQLRTLVMRKGTIDVCLRILDNMQENKRTSQPSQSPSLSLPPPRQPPADSVIHFQDVSFQYPTSKTPTIKHLTLTIPKGQRVLITGRIGCGKSTLLKLIMKYKLHTQGEIYLMGQPYSQLSAQKVRTTIGYVPQSSILFNRSIYENITYGLENVSKKEVEELLHSMNLNHIFDGFKEGLDASVGKNGSRLSGGQRQIVWILRVILKNPSILLMDEPTASIDEKTKDHVRELLSKVMEGRTVIMVTHDDYLERFADRTIEMQAGNIVNDTLLASSKTKQMY